MIDPKDKPIGNRNPYKPVDLAARRPRHPEIITEEDYRNLVNVPDDALYDFDWDTKVWRLRK